jgi:hypothetical protein
VLLGGCVAAFDRPLLQADRLHLRPDLTWLFVLDIARVHRVVLSNPDNPARNGRTPSRIRALRLLLAFHVASTSLMVPLFSLWALPTAQHARALSGILARRISVLGPACVVLAAFDTCLLAPALLTYVRWI